MTRRTQPHPATDAEAEDYARLCEERWADEEAEEAEREHATRLAIRRTFGLPDDTVGTDEF